MNPDSAENGALVRLHAELEEFSGLLGRLSIVSQRTDPERRLDLVNLRRELAQRIGSISNAAQTLFQFNSWHHCESEFRQKLSAVRNGIALHQATWPAVSINEADAAFLSSANKVRQANLAFLDWARQMTNSAT